ncbi:DUF1622 domain-containing protein [Bdellovibrio sp. HCB274]|uniref:DUF1622 domain-containing protein n=1 Tax=Bdellovibrio sp. HCB274 TaxID=3394361 RepID=UPI0039B6A945
MESSSILSIIDSNLGVLAKIVEVWGVLIIVLGGLVATYNFLRQHFSKEPNAYENLRSSLGKSILLGLEFLVAGDIIGTVAVEPTFTTLGVLSLIVLIRTFLSFSLEVEIEGRWPWSRVDRSLK